MAFFIKLVVFNLLYVAIFCNVLKDGQRSQMVDFLEPISNKIPVKNMKNDQPKKQAIDINCGYQSCNAGKSDMINLHLVPHTHDDVGWLLTVDEYFYNEVQFILDTVINELNNDPLKRFSYVELGFFSRWWKQQSSTVKDNVRQLVNEGRLEFILGGWSMDDEASTHYQAIIDQHTHGFRFLHKNFGQCWRPRVGWQIDPFGHSREQASLFAQFGFDGLFFARIDFQDYDARKAAKNLEHVWFGSDSTVDQSTLFTGALYDTSYGEPAGFCFECGDPQIKDDENLDDYNVDDVLIRFFAKVNEQSKSFRTNHIMWTMGSDFQYQNARVNFKNMDKLIRLANAKQSEGSKVNVFYSTPSCYLKAVNNANVNFSSKADDFFPYAHRNHSFWTGYFTSRPALKGYERTSNNFLQICKQLDFFANIGNSVENQKKIGTLKGAIGVVQHHDGVSGTSKQHVAFNYAKHLAEGILECQDVVNSSMAKIVSRTGSLIFNGEFCPLLNVSNCPTSTLNDQVAIVMYNPLGVGITKILRLPIVGIDHVIIDETLDPISTQVNELSEETMQLPDYAGSTATHEIIFKASLPPLGFYTFFLTKGNNKLASKSAWNHRQSNMADVVISNEFLSITFDGVTGLLKSVANIQQSITIALSQELRYYVPWVGNNDGGNNQASGAYIFRPNGTSSYPVADGQILSALLIQGPLVQEVRQVFSDWSSQVIRLYKNAMDIEIEWTVGHIPVNPVLRQGKEIISNFVTDLKTDGTYYTDANGRQILKRIRDYRPTWDLKQTEPIAGNYYPINSRIYIRDVTKNAQLTILTDRSQGGGSIKDGQLELMLHRRLLVDDALGVSEGLNEPGLDGKGLFVRGTYSIFVSSIQSSSKLHRPRAIEIYSAPALVFQPITSVVDYANAFILEWTAMREAVPENVHLLTLETLNDTTILLRLEHIYELHEDIVLSRPVNVSLKNLFSIFKIESVSEQILPGFHPLQGTNRLRWNVEGFGSTKTDMGSFVKPVTDELFTVELNPMQIRTFFINVTHNDQYEKQKANKNIPERRNLFFKPHNK